MSCLIGHHVLGFDVPVLHQFGITFDVDRCLDTLVVSRLINFAIEGGHSLEAWGERLGEKKIGLDIKDWTCYTKDILQRCIQDTLVNLHLYNYLKKYITNPFFKNSLRLEHDIATICQSIKANGFTYDIQKSKELKQEVQERLQVIDNSLVSSFPPKRVLVDTITPRFTKEGMIHATDFRRLRAAGIPEVSIENGRTYEIWEEQPYNPGSLHQTIDRLWDAGWKPTEKTKGHNELRSHRRGLHVKSRVVGDKDDELKRRMRFERYGWKLSEDNLRTLPSSAPEAARSLVERLLLASRLSDLEEWESLCRTNVEGSGERSSDGSAITRVHGTFDGIGSWTHRLASNKPNMQNIPVAQHKDNPSPIDVLSDSINDRMRGLWVVPKGKRLLGVDADGIQMRIFAHYVNDQRLIKALVEGSKKDGTDIHSLHWSALGQACKGRNPAKTFIYAWLLGAGQGKVAEILECPGSEARDSILRFIDFYPGLKELKQGRIPSDAERGYFEGLDGRLVIVPSEHKVLAGYLQNGEAIVMKRATRWWTSELQKERIPFKLVTWPHDEWQTEIPDDDDVEKFVMNKQIESIVRQGIELNLNCPLAASGRSGYNWKETH